MNWSENIEGLLEIIASEPKYGVFLDTGTGKTSLMLAVIESKIMTENLKKVLIVAPKEVTLATWQDEIAKFNDFVFMLPLLDVISSKDTPAKRLEILKKQKEQEYSITIIASSLIVWLKTALKKDYFFDLYIIDECSQFKNPTTQRFKAMDAMLKSTKTPQRYLLSGTPFPNIHKKTHAINRNGKDYVYEHGEELYYVLKWLGIYIKSFYIFKQEYMFSYYWEDYASHMKERDYDDLINKISEFSISEILKMDIKKKEQLVYCPIDENVLKKMINDFYLETDDLREITAVNQANMINKTLQLSNGFMFDTEGRVVRLNKYKLEVLKDVISMLGDDKRVIIFTPFIEDRKIIKEEFKDAYCLPDAKNESEKIKIIENWNEKLIRMLILSPYSTSHGLNLQHGGSTIIWFGLVWSAEKYIQGNARVYRRGQKKDVNIYLLVANKGYEPEYVYNRLQSKKTTLQEFKKITEKIKGGNKK